LNANPDTRFQVPENKTTCQAKCCWPSPVHSFLVPSLMELMIILHCLSSLGVMQHNFQLAEGPPRLFLDLLYSYRAMEWTTTKTPLTNTTL
jgi:hypothetical protein